MEDQATQIEHEDKAARPVSDADLVAIAKLLAAGAGMLAEMAVLRRRGPTLLRRAISVWLTFMIIITVCLVRQRALVERLRSLIMAMQLQWNPVRPPQSWAAP